MTTVSCSLEMCRCCGKIADPDELLHIDFAVDVKEELIQCWKIEITDMDGLPQHICQLCHVKFDDYLEFRKKCRKLQEELKALYKNFKSTMGRISIKKKSCAENKQYAYKGLEINQISASGSEKNIKGTQNQNQSPENILVKIENMDYVNEGIIDVQQRNQSFQEMVNKLIHNKKNVVKTRKSENTMQKQIQIQYSKGIFSKLEANEEKVANMQKIENKSQNAVQNQSSQEIDNRLVKTNVANRGQKVKTMQIQNRNRICNASAKDAVEFIVFPDISFSKETISQTFMNNIIKRETDNANTDPLHDSEINTEFVQYAEDCKNTEVKTENKLNLEKTTINVDGFFEETSQSTTVSDRLNVEWDNSELLAINEEFDNRLVKEIESSLDETMPLKCKYCISDSDDPFLHNKNFPTKEKLIEHILHIHDPEFPYKCQSCKKKKYRTSQICIYHIMHTHKQNRDICQACGIGPGSFRRFIEHKKRFHSFGDYECEICAKMFENVSLTWFDYHKRWHNRNRQMQCTYCAKIFVQLPHLKAHEMIHTKNYKIKCEICDKGCRTQFDKAIHLYKVHGGDKPIKCLHCDKRFTNYGQRSAHMIKIHNHILETVDEKVQCLKCKKRFRREAGYRRHLETDCLSSKIKPIPKPVKKFSCDQCSCRFKTEPGLRQHLVLHSKEGRPFECHICHLNYKTSSNLDSHHKLCHSSIKPHKCDLCGKGFAYRYGLNEHMRFHKIKLDKIKQSVKPNNIDNFLPINDVTDIFNT